MSKFLVVKCSCVVLTAMKVVAPQLDGRARILAALIFMVILAIVGYAVYSITSLMKPYIAPLVHVRKPPQPPRYV